MARPIVGARRPSPQAEPRGRSAAGGAGRRNTPGHHRAAARSGPRTVGELAEGLPVSRPAVSQHLKVLRDAGVVKETRQGVRHYFALDAGALDDLRRHFEALWQDVMLSFADYVKERENARKRK